MQTQPEKRNINNINHINHSNTSDDPSLGLVAVRSHRPVTALQLSALQLVSAGNLYLLANKQGRIHVMPMDTPIYEQGPIHNISRVWVGRGSDAVYLVLR